MHEKEPIASTMHEWLMKEQSKMSIVTSWVRHKVAQAGYNAILDPTLAIDCHFSETGNQKKSFKKDAKTTPKNGRPLTVTLGLRFPWKMTNDGDRTWEGSFDSLFRDETARCPLPLWSVHLEHGSRNRWLVFSLVTLLTYKWTLAFFATNI